MAVYNMTFGFLAYESVNLISIEIGCLCHFMPDTIAQVANTCEVAKKTIKSLFEQAAHVAVSCSYRIFNSGASPDWDLLVCLKLHAIINSVSVARAPVLFIQCLVPLSLDPCT